MIEKKIVSESFKSINKILNKKSKGLHDPLFTGNEKKYLANCIKSGFVSSVGKYVRVFERKVSDYVKTKYAVATNSGTSALHLVLKYYNLGVNDEVLMPSLTYVATANAVKYCNSFPNFVDVETDTLGICPQKLETYLRKSCKKKNNFTFNKKTGRKVKILIAVHLYGFPCKIFQIKKICKKYNIILVEDAAEALGSFYKNRHLGTFGEAGILSFNGNKPITCGSGGMIITNNKKMSKKLEHLSVHAKKKHPTDHIHDAIGYNYRMNNLSAAIGCAQMEKINFIIRAKRKNFKKYINYFKNNKFLKILKEPNYSKTNYWLITAVLLNNSLKNKLLRTFRKKGYICRSVWRPLHTLKIFYGCPRDNLSNTLNIFNRSISLPSSPSISYKK